jgi:hypothetical protein
LVRDFDVAVNVAVEAFAVVDVVARLILLVVDMLLLRPSLLLLSRFG